MAYKAYNICLVGLYKSRTKISENLKSFSKNKQSLRKYSDIQVQKNDFTVLINPGKEYLLKADDICIYTSLIKEQNFNWKMKIDKESSSYLNYKKCIN
jgi:hypothetical protein